MINLIGDICLGLSLAIIFIATVLFIVAIAALVARLIVAVIDKLLED